MLENKEEIKNSFKFKQLEDIVKVLSYSVVDGPSTVYKGPSYSVYKGPSSLPIVARVVDLCRASAGLLTRSVVE